MNVTFGKYLQSDEGQRLTSLLSDERDGAEGGGSKIVKTSLVVQRKLSRSERPAQRLKKGALRNFELVVWL